MKNTISFDNVIFLLDKIHACDYDTYEPRIVHTSCGSPDDVICPFLGQASSKNKFWEVVAMTFAIYALIVLIYTIAINGTISATISFVFNFEFALKMILIPAAMRDLFYNTK